jgi:hypothetical protein
LTDSKFNTKGTLNGNQRIIILEIGNGLAIGTKRLLVLNTVDKEDAAYYGTAFIWM